jgi:putative DNA primase/helicase
MNKTAPHSSRKVERENWLWPGRIPEGHLTLLGGETGAGKSLIVADVIARVTVEAEWPDGAGQAPKGEVLVISEDPVASMQNPRLLAAGADLTKIRHWKGSFCIEQDLADLEADLVKHPKTKLLVIDPLQDCMLATTYRKTREVLLKLRAVAEDQGIAIVAMGHPPKGLSYPKDSFGGSRGIPTAARAFWFVTENDARHLMLFVKCNCPGRNRDGLQFRADVKPIPVPPQSVEGLYLTWDDEPVMMTAEDWWFTEKGRRNEAEPRRARDIATAFLEEFLEDGPKPADEVVQGAARRGIRRGTLQTAKQALGILAVKQPVAHGSWTWSLPARERPAAPEEPEPDKTEPKSKSKNNRVVGVMAERLREVSGQRFKDSKIQSFPRAL